ncbi:glycosyl hydrolase [Frankia sp. AvcI1]|nr:glycosyl hydrolase [Frankia sp. AvcI1]
MTTLATPSHNAMDMCPGDAWVDVVGLDAYEFYFNNCDPGNIGSNNLYRPLGGDCVYVNPNAAARYKQRYSAN